MSIGTHLIMAAAGNSTGVPGAPTIGTATATGSTTATITFTPPASSGASPITSYTVISSPGGITTTVSAPATSISITGLTNQTDYTFKVYATNASGNSPDSSSSNLITTFAFEPGTVFTYNSGNSTISRITPAGVATNAWSSSVSLNSYTNGIAIDYLGNVYTANVNDTVSKISASGVKSTYATYTPGDYTYALDVDSFGNLFVSLNSADRVARIGFGGSNNPNWSIINSQYAPSIVKTSLSGTVYVTSPVSLNGRILLIDSSGTASASGLLSSVPTSMAVDSSGTAYVGQYLTNEMGKVSSAGSSTSPWVSIPGGPGEVAIDSSGNIYTTSGANILKITPAGVITNPWVTLPSTVGGINFDNYGNLYAALPNDNKVAKITSSGVVTSSWASLAAASNPIGIYIFNPKTAPAAPTIGTASAASATSASVSFTPNGNGGSPITGYTVTSSPGGITATGSSSPITVTGLTTGVAYTFTVTATNAIGTSAASSASNSVTPQTWTGNVFVTWRNGANPSGVAKVSPAGIVNSTWGNAGGGSQSKSPAINKSNGNVYVINNGGINVLEFDSTGASSNSFSSATAIQAMAVDSTVSDRAYYSNGTSSIFKLSGGSALFFASATSSAWGLACDSSGNVYATMTSGPNNLVRKYDNAGTTVWTTSSSFGSVNGSNIIVDSSGNSYVATSSSNITKISADGNTVTTAWATVASNVNVMTFDSSGTIYAGLNNDTVVKITPAGVVTSAWATLTSGASIAGIGVDAFGNVYTANFGLGTISKITSAGSVTNNWASIGSGFTTGLVVG